MKIYLIGVGKTKEGWLLDALCQYEKRLKGKVTFEHLWLKNDTQLLGAVEKAPHPICLDPRGKHYTTEQFAAAMNGWGAHYSFIIGGPDGLPVALREKYPLFSLSSLTFTHQMVRLLLVEQLYRGYLFNEGHPYHRS